MKNIFNKTNENIIVKKENEIFSLRSKEVGSITHYVSLNSGRCTFYTSEHARETCKPSVNVAATYDEIEKMRDVFNEILSLMKSRIPEEKKATKIKHPSGKKGFLITTANGKTISILDFGSVMATAPKEIRDCVYLGIEAWDGEQSFRANTFEEVEEMLKKKYTLNY